MKIRKIIMVTLVTVCLVAGLAGCTTYDNFKNTFIDNKATASDTIKIGVLEPQTGNDSHQASIETSGIELAHKLYPEAMGKKVELIYEDTQSSIYTAESAVQDLIDKKPAVILGSYGDACSLVAGKYLKESKTPGITMTATNPLITENNSYYFRVSFSEASQGNAIADYAGIALKQKKIALITMENDDTVNDLVNNFNKEYAAVTKKTGGKVTEIQLKQDSTNIDDCLNQLKNEQITTVFMAAPLDNAKQLFEEADRLKLNGLTVIGPKEWHSSDLIGLQNKFKGIKIAAASDFNAESADTKYYDEFVKAYTKKYGNSTPDQAAALGFDAYMLAINAIEQAGSVNGTKVRDALGQTKNFSGASGVITFDNGGEPKKPINIDIIKNSMFKTVYTIQ